jgi:hypothetical protein
MSPENAIQDRYDAADAAMRSETQVPRIYLTAADWGNLADVMRSLTWGKDCADQWWRLYRKVEKQTEQPTMERD